MNEQKPEAAGLRTATPLLEKFLDDQSGQDLIEYALVAALVGLGAVTAMSGLSNQISNVFNSVSAGITNAI